MFPFKIKYDPLETPNERDIKNIIEQNNFTNQNLKTIGDQLTKIEDTVREEKVKSQSMKEIVPIFKYFEISRKHHNQLQGKDLLEEINKRLDILELIHSVLDTPE